MKNLLTGIVAFTLSSIVLASQPQLKSDVPDNYTVIKGDTLWDISGRFLQNPWMWPEIWHVNTQIENPHLIYPGDIIRLIYLEGQPRLTLTRADGGRTYKLSPQVRELTAEEAIETIPLDKINSFLSKSRVVGKRDLQKAPYILSGADEHLVVGAGDQAYARGSFEETYTVYGVYRGGDKYIDPETKEFLGVQAFDIGTGTLVSVEDEIGTLDITRTTEEIRIGDRLLRQEERPIDSTFYPSPPATDIKGVILAVEGGVSQVGKMDVVVINRGEREGMVPGNVMAVYKRGGKIRDRVTGDTVKLPDERAGLMMVFKTFEKVSFGLVLEAKQGLKVGDLIQNP